MVWLPPGRGSKSKIALDKLEEAKMDKSVSFEKDIVPIFRQFRDSMMWRLDLTSFDDLKANASMIYNQILWTPGTPVTPQNMPPPPYPPLTQAEIALFKAWMDGGFPSELEAPNSSRSRFRSHILQNRERKRPVLLSSWGRQEFARDRNVVRK